MTLSTENIKAICQWLLKLKVPDGYCAKLSQWVNANRSNLSGMMKSHDFHVFVERLLSLVARELLPKEPCEAIIELSYFFKELCAKMLKISDLELLEERIVITLCKLEKVFPPAFFDIMIHLSIHLAWEAKVAGPVQYIWMYLVESYVRNKARPEGSIAEGYLADECVTFCSRYLSDEAETKFNKEERNFDEANTSSLSIFSLPGKPIGRKKLLRMSSELHKVATYYVLANCDECLPYIKEHKDILLKEHGADRVDKLHMSDFAKWFCDRITQLNAEGKGNLQMLYLAQGPGKRAAYYKGYNIHVFKFHTQLHNDDMKTQNYGVMVKCENQEDVPWYGTLTKIVELLYPDNNKVVLFNCNWYNTVNDSKGYKLDRYGIFSVNTKEKLNTQEPFVLAFQSTQVYYIEGIKNSKWSVVVETKPRNCYEMPTDDGDAYQEEETHANQMYANLNQDEDDAQ